MTDDNSPENLRKFLESDDPAMVMMGLSMAKGSAKASNEVLGMVLGLYLFHNDKDIRSLAKTTFGKLAPSDLRKTVNQNGDWYLTAEEAVDYGFADAVLGQKGYKDIGCLISKK